MKRASFYEVFIRADDIKLKGRRDADLELLILLDYVEGADDGKTLCLSGSGVDDTDDAHDEECEIDKTEERDDYRCEETEVENSEDRIKDR